MSCKRQQVQLPKDFFTKSRPHVMVKESKEDSIPFQWSNEVITGKKKAILYSVKN